MNTHSGNVNTDSGIVITYSGKFGRSVHDGPEWPFIIHRNQRSRSNGMGVHDAPEYALSTQIPNIKSDHKNFIGKIAKDLQPTEPGEQGGERRRFALLNKWFSLRGQPGGTGKVLYLGFLAMAVEKMMPVVAADLLRGS